MRFLIDAKRFNKKRERERKRAFFFKRFTILTLSSLFMFGGGKDNQDL